MSLKCLNQHHDTKWLKLSVKRLKWCGLKENIFGRIFYSSFVRLLSQSILGVSEFLTRFIVCNFLGQKIKDCRRGQKNDLYRQTELISEKTNNQRMKF